MNARTRQETLTMDVAGVRAEVTWKAVRALRLRLTPPNGDVRVSAPWGCSKAAVAGFIEANRDWIERKRERWSQSCASRELRDGDLVSVWGRAHRLVVRQTMGRPRVEQGGDEVCLSVRPGVDAQARQAIMAVWRHELVRAAALPLLAEWGQVLGVRMTRLTVREMTSRWGSCTPATGAIRLNARLAERPHKALEYVVVHELAHLIEASHNARFWSVVGSVMPDWRARRALLNAPLMDGGEHTV